MNIIMLTKSEMRSRLKAKREELTLEQRREKSYRITKHLESLLSEYSTVIAYVSKDPEVETLVAINHLLENKKTVIVPIIQKETKTLRFSYLDSVADLEPGTFMVPEPLSHEKPANPATAEVVILPVVGFDESGNRIGYGAGYYDRFLKEYPGIRKIGVAYSCQEEREIPADVFDIKMDCVVTEDGVIVCEKNISKGL